jgi:uncharacterized protein (DUF433 family)
MDALLERISIDPKVCFGKPCIRGTRLWVSLLLDFLAAGTTIEEILAEYPQLEREDVLAAIAYGAEMSRERFVDLPRPLTPPSPPAATAPGTGASGAGWLRGCW